MKKYVIGMLATNEAGVLNRITGLFGRRGFNIVSITAGETEDPKLSRLTVTFVGDDYARDQAIRQAAKCVDVEYIKELPIEKSITRELVMLKVATDDADMRKDVMDAIAAFKAKQIDYSSRSVVVELTGESAKIDSFIELMKPYGILELCRTGTVAMDRGTTCLKDA